VRVACRLRDLRGDRTLADLAAATGISQGQLSEIERGIRFPRDTDIPALEQAYGAEWQHWYRDVEAPLGQIALIPDDEDRHA
jgi:transcriptional regulator with XRE-family HTH domain